jgi:hypothetical protein
MMHTGDVWELAVPGKLGFGEKGRSASPGKPRIPANAVRLPPSHLPPAVGPSRIWMGGAGGGRCGRKRGCDVRSGQERGVYVWSSPRPEAAHARLDAPPSCAALVRCPRAPPSCAALLSRPLARRRT